MVLLLALIALSTSSTTRILAQVPTANNASLIITHEGALARKLFGWSASRQAVDADDKTGVAEGVGPKVWMGLGEVEVGLRWTATSDAAGYTLALEGSGMHWTLLAHRLSYTLPALKPDRAYTAVLTALPAPEPAPEDGVEQKLLFTSPALISEEGNIYEMIEETREKNCSGTMDITEVTLSIKLEGLSSPGMVLEAMELSSETPLQWVDLPVNSTIAYLSGLRPDSFVKLSLKQMQASNPTTFKDILTKRVFTGGCLPPPTSNLTRTLFDLFFPTKTSSSRWNVRCYADDEVFTGYPCHNSDVCIPKNWMCDKDDDCPDGDDEHHCGSNHYHNSFCSKTEFRCVRRREHVCLPISWLCDGRHDCTDGWDEEPRNCRGYYGRPGGLSYQHEGGCRHSYFRCHNHLGCIAPSFVCDGEHDCADGSDEWNCDTGYDYECDTYKEFQCFDSRGKDHCIPRSWMCDDHEDCAHGEDEDIDICRRVL